MGFIVSAAIAGTKTTGRDVGDRVGYVGEAHGLICTGLLEISMKVNWTHVGKTE